MRKPTAEEVRELRNTTGEGMCSCKRHLEKKYLVEAINELPYSSVELKEILLKIVELSVHDSLRVM